MSNSIATAGQDKIVVVASSDDNYAIPMHVMFVSLLENAARPDRFEIFVIDGGISEKKKNNLENDISARGGNVAFLQVDDGIYADFPTQKHISAPAYYRISIPELFNETVKRAIYLDCDLIIKADLEELWSQDLGPYAIAAVENIAGSTYLKSGLAQSDYFNSGVIIIDLVKWREQNIPEKVRTFKMEHPELISTNDQCAFNGVFRGEWARLPLHWNMQSGLYRNRRQVERLKQNGAYEKAVWTPSIIHYIGWSKPWVIPCFHPLEGEYRRYLEMSVYRHEPLEEVGTPVEYTAIKVFRKNVQKKRWQKKYRSKGINLYP
jgi:lipopolysaccharide biosynthesis glycosyltransferase